MKCIHPTVINCNGSKRLVPCGRCAWCRKRKRDEWFLRFLVQSMKQPCYFVTLTYEDSQIPIRYVSLDTGETFVCRGLFEDDEFVSVGSVPFLADFQKYLKRYRANTGKKLKYFFVSEYGHLYGRVHYHFLAWSDDDISDIGKDWYFGESVVVPASIGAMKYVTKYILKGSNHKSTDLRDSNLMSCSNGIGGDFWQELVSKYKSPNFTNTFQYLGSFHAFPQYWKKKIREQIDYDSDMVVIKFSRDNDGNIVVKNLHCKELQELDQLRSIPEINDNDLLHQLLKLKIKDLPSYIQELYSRDYDKQVEINTKLNPQNPF